jgi:2-polyprenyl-3-methyl-5-hydroxy-6-metoxy-1,4-benzoquinol methylase
MSAARGEWRFLSQIVSEYYQTVIMASPSDLRSRLYEAHASQHAGCGGDEAVALAYQRYIRPLLPPSTAGPVVGLGRGRGEIVRLMQADGFDAEGIDNPEQAPLAREAGVARARWGDFRAILAAHPDTYAAIIATDLLEHLTKAEVLQTFDGVSAALARVTVWQVVSTCYRTALTTATGILRGHAVTQNLTFAARKGAVTVKPAES